jgi:hypothetical protein
MAVNLVPCLTRTSKHDFEALCLFDFWSKCVETARILNRFYICIGEGEGEEKTEGTHSACGPPNYDIEIDFLDNQDPHTLIKVDMFESTLIYQYLVRLNAILKEINISTIQSGPAYYENDLTFIGNPCYLQNPWIEFIGDLSSIAFFKLLVKHPDIQEFMITTSQESSYNIPKMEEEGDDRKIIKCAFIRPYFNQNGEVIATFDDTLFWETIIRCVEETKKMSLESKDVFDVLRNDPELDKDRDWFVYNKDRFTIKIEDKENVNPLNGFPLTTLEVRYDQDFPSFIHNLE